MKRIMLLSLLFGLNSCLLLWNEALDQEEVQSDANQALALAGLSSACSDLLAPTVTGIAARSGFCEGPWALLPL